jgi:hypothetical protein
MAWWLGAGKLIGNSEEKRRNETKKKRERKRETEKEVESS